MGPGCPVPARGDPVLGQQPQRRHPGTALSFILFLLDTSCPGIHASATQVSVPAVSPALLARHLCAATRRCILSLPLPYLQATSASAILSGALLNLLFCCIALKIEIV